MAHACQVPNCENNNNKFVSANKISVFRVPQNDEKLSLWEQNLGCKLRKNRKICEKHFHKKDVKKCIVIKDSNGKIVQKVSYLVQDFKTMFYVERLIAFHVLLSKTSH